jgi:hypothetical protein
MFHGRGLVGGFWNCVLWFGSLKKLYCASILNGNSINHRGLHVAVTKRGQARDSMAFIYLAEIDMLVPP